MGKLDGKIAVVTGASKGIGAGIAKSLGAEGASVVVNYASDRDGAEQTVRAIESKGGKARAVQADVSKEADVKRLFATVKEAFGRLDVLVNNAGVYRFGPVESVTTEGFHLHFDTNVLGTLLAVREALPLFGTQGGSIVNVGSNGTSLAPPGAVMYVASKASLEAITRVLAKELGPRRIRVNAVNPGPVVTPGVRDLVDTPFIQGAIAVTPLGRIGQPEDIGPVAAFLASDEAAWVTGEVLLASGGLR